MSRIAEKLAPDLFGYPFAPGWKREDSSREAAEAIKPSAEMLREKIYRAIKDAGSYGATADEASAAINVSPFAGRPRVTELRAVGRIKPSMENKRRPSSTGRSSIVWIAT